MIFDDSHSHCLSNVVPIVKFDARTRYSFEHSVRPSLGSSVRSIRNTRRRRFTTLICQRLAVMPRALRPSPLRAFEEDDGDELHKMVIPVIRSPPHETKMRRISEGGVHGIEMEWVVWSTPLRSLPRSMLQAWTNLPTPKIIPPR